MELSLTDFGPIVVEKSTFVLIASTIYFLLVLGIVIEFIRWYFFKVCFKVI